MLILLGTLAIGGLLSPNPALTNSRPVQETDVRDLLQRFFAAVQKKDLEALKSMWSGQSPASATTNPESQPIFEELAEADLSTLTINRITIDSGEATAWVSVKRRSGNPKSPAKAVVAAQTNLTIHLGKEGDAWKVAHYRSSEEELANAIAAAKDDGGRRALLDEHRDLITVQLDKALLVIADRLIGQGGYPQALELYRIIGPIAAQINDKVGVADVCLGVGVVSFRTGDYQKALERYQESLHIYEEAGDKKGIARVLGNIGSIHKVQGRVAQALEFYQKGLEVYRDIGDKRGIASLLHNIGTLYQAHGDFSRALESFETSLKISEEVGDKQTAGVTLLAIGQVYSYQGNYPQTQVYFQRALRTFTELGLKPRIADALSDIGNIMTDQGNYPEAIEQFQNALAIKDALGDKAGIAIALNNIAVIEYRQGNYSQALRHFERALHIGEELGLKAVIGLALNNIGLLHQTEGNYSQALGYYERSLSLSRQAEAKHDIPLALINIAQVHMDLGNSTEARKSYQEGLKAAEESGNTESISGALKGLGDLELALATYPQASVYLQRSLAAREQTGNERGIADTLCTIGEVYNAEGQYVQAVEVEERAAAIARKIHSPEQLITALTAVAKAYLATGKPDQARKDLLEAITTVEQLRGLVAGSEKERQGFLEREIAPYRAMAGVLINENRSSEALAFAEQAKARALIDVLGSGRANLTKALTLDEKAEEQKINSRVVSLNTLIIKEKVRKDADQKHLADLTAQLDRARLEYDDFRTNLYVAHPDLKIQRAEFQAVSLRECGDLLPDRHTALLEFAVSDDQTYLFVLARKNSSQITPDLKVYMIDVKSKELADLCSQFREQLSQKGLGFHSMAGRLYELLLGPAAADLEGRTNLVIVPDGPLWDLPFQALQPAPHRYMIEEHAVSYAPSLTALREMSRRARSPIGARAYGKAGPPTMLLAFGNPALGAETSSEIKEVFMDADLAPLPQAETQVHQVASLYGPAQSKVYTGAEATEDRLKAEAPTARILHIAAHGIVNNASPLYSQLVLARGEGGEDDGLLEAWEIMNMDLKADLVVLAACDTARGRYGAGEGMIGLSWAFFVAGCPTTVVSQWSVEAESTSRLMVEFHRNLLAGLTKAEALRRAELKLLKDDVRYRRPYYWAPFVVIGSAN